VQIDVIWFTLNAQNSLVTNDHGSALTLLE